MVCSGKLRIFNVHLAYNCTGDFGEQFWAVEEVHKTQTANKGHWSTAVHGTDGGQNEASVTQREETVETAEGM